jgi:hypothetical protein
MLGLRFCAHEHGRGVWHVQRRMVDDCAHTLE